MNWLMLMAILTAAGTKPAQANANPVQAEAKPLEEVLASVKQPNGKHVMVMTHILVEKVDAKSLHVKFMDAKGRSGVNIKKWDPKLSKLKPGTTLTVVGELHFGAVSGGTPSIRYKVKEISGRPYNDHRHWRTDQAIYIINPTYEISAPAEEKPAKANQSRS
jgi:hypothetical protein